MYEHFPTILGKRNPTERDFFQIKNNITYESLSFQIQSVKNRLKKSYDFMLTTRDQLYQDRKEKIDSLKLQIKDIMHNQKSSKIVSLEKKDQKKNQQKEKLEKLSFVDTNFLQLLQHKEVMNAWKPQSREIVSMCQYRHTMYAYGGKGSVVFSEIAKFETDLLQWSPVPIKDMIPPGRFANTINYYQNKLYIFGGRLDFKVNTPINELLIFNLCIFLNLETSKFESIKTNQTNIKPRYYHSSCLVGRFLLISGGLDKFTSPVIDFIFLDLQKLEWYNIKLTAILFKHTSTCVFDADRKIDNILIQNHFIEDKYFKTQIKEEGIYIFKEKLQIMQFVEGKVLLNSPQTIGLAPQGRMLHTACYNSIQKLYSIIGGTNNANNILGDFYVLNVRNMNWMEINVQGQKLEGRINHMAFFDNSIYIFGGHNYKNYFTFDPYIVSQGKSYIKDTFNPRNLLQGNKSIKYINQVKFDK